jgi:hypothetical protein
LYAGSGFEIQYSNGLLFIAAMFQEAAKITGLSGFIPFVSYEIPEVGTVS